METFFAIIEVIGAFGKNFFAMLSAYFGLKFIGYSDMKNDYWWGIVAIIFGIWSL